MVKKHNFFKVKFIFFSFAASYAFSSLNSCPCHLQHRPISWRQFKKWWYSQHGFPNPWNYLNIICIPFCLLKGPKSLKVKKHIKESLVKSSNMALGIFFLQLKHIVNMYISSFSYGWMKRKCWIETHLWNLFMLTHRCFLFSPLSTIYWRVFVRFMTPNN